MIKKTIGLFSLILLIATPLHGMENDNSMSNQANNSDAMKVLAETIQAVNAGHGTRTFDDIKRMIQDADQNSLVNYRDPAGRTMIMTALYPEHGERNEAMHLLGLLPKQKSPHVVRMSSIIKKIYDKIPHEPDRKRLTKAVDAYGKNALWLAAAYHASPSLTKLLLKNGARNSRSLQMSLEDNLVCSCARKSTCIHRKIERLINKK
jgi:hypothetical protein